MEIKTLVEIRGGRVRIQERDNETTVTIAHEGEVDAEEYAKLKAAWELAATSQDFRQKKIKELATALEESRALVDQRDKALDQATKDRAADHREIFKLRGERDAQHHARLATVRRIGEVERALVKSEKRADDLENQVAEEKRQREINREWAVRAENLAREQELEHAKQLQAAKARAGGYDGDRHTEQKRANEAEARLASRNEMIEKIADQVTGDRISEALGTFSIDPAYVCLIEAVSEIRSILDGGE